MNSSEFLEKELAWSARFCVLIALGFKTQTSLQSSAFLRPLGLEAPPKEIGLKDWFEKRFALIKQKFPQGTRSTSCLVGGLRRPVFQKFKKIYIDSSHGLYPVK